MGRKRKEKVTEISTETTKTKEREKKTKAKRVEKGEGSPVWVANGLFSQWEQKGGRE